MATRLAAFLHQPASVLRPPALAVFMWASATASAQDPDPARWLSSFVAEQLPEPAPQDTPVLLYQFHSKVFHRSRFDDAVELNPSNFEGPDRQALPMEPNDELTTDFSGGALLVGRRRAAALDANGKLIVRSTLGRLQLQQGRLFVQDLGSPTNSQFGIDTPNGTIAELGTEYHVQVTADGTEIVLLRGRLELVNPMGRTNLTERGDVGLLLPGVPPQKLTSRLTAYNDVIEWVLYYPAVLNLDDLGPDEAVLDADPRLAASLAAYRRGNLPQAAGTYPWEHPAQHPAAQVYEAALHLSSDRVTQASDVLSAALSQPAVTDRVRQLAGAIRELIDAVKFAENDAPAAPSCSTEWLARSYYEQSKGRLSAARDAARQALEAAPRFGFAQVRVAELEFGYGDRAAVRTRVEQALEPSPGSTPENAQALTLLGFVEAADHQWDQARDTFSQAAGLDGRLGNAWLGLGLLNFRLGETPLGLHFLRLAVAQEPQRSFLRSYLGKGFHEAGDPEAALDELQYATLLDPNDPTPPLYSALVKADDHRFNDAIRDLETSKERNANRRLYRSSLRLDEDLAVRSANLAALYREAGLIDLSVREASLAANDDYLNYAAHLFLASSYDALRDPRQVTLRFETPWLNELLLANLLQPAGAGGLSQNISQQEYTRLFDRNHLGAFSLTEYTSNGDWQQAGSLYGNFTGLGFSVDSLYRSFVGEQANGDSEDLTLWTKLKVAPWRHGDFFFQTVHYWLESGDVRQYYDPGDASRTFRTEEDQQPLALLGYHHEWHPDSHTLVLVSRLDDRLQVRDARSPAFAVYLNATNGLDTTFPPPTFATDLDYQSDLEIYSAELQHLYRTETSVGTFQAILGGRAQAGEFETSNLLRYRTGLTHFPPILLNAPIASQDVSSDFSRYAAYGYLQYEPADPWLLVAGISYDQVRYPVNHRIAPVSAEEDTRDQVSPKAGLTWRPSPRTTLRAAYTRSLGGVSFDQSFRLEPAQVAGFVQSYRSLIPESLTGSLVAPTFETRSISLEHRFGTNVYASLTGEWLESEAGQVAGVFAAKLYDPLAPASEASNLDFTEKSLLATLNYLHGSDWSFGLRYRLAEAELTQSGTPSAATGVDLSSLLHELRLNALYQARGGFYSEIETVWRHQENHGNVPSLSGDDYWHLNLYTGYRFHLGRRSLFGPLFSRPSGEIRLGLLNVTDQDYRLFPLNFYQAQPRGRTFFASLRLEF